MSKYHRILVAIDGSEMSASVLQTAEEFVQADTEVYIVKVIDFPGTLGAIDEKEMIQSDYVKAEKEVQAIIDAHPEITKQAKEVNIEFPVGNPTRIIAEQFPEEHNIDLIIVGKTTKTSLLDKIFVGNTAKAIVENADCDVIVVKTPL